MKFPLPCICRLQASLYLPMATPGRPLPTSTLARGLLEAVIPPPVALGFPLLTPLDTLPLTPLTTAPSPLVTALLSPATPALRLKTSRSREFSVFTREIELLQPATA